MSDGSSSRLRDILNALGPGLVMAGAAIGVSHLVQSTRAGAEYGYVAAVLILAACLFKYPFLEYGPRYAAATGESLLDGYRRLGSWATGVFGLLTVGTMFIVLAGVTAVTAGLMGWLAGTTPNLTLWSGVVLGTCIVILMWGRYQLLDRVMKVIMALLAVSTVVAAVAAVVGPSPEMVETPAGPGALLTTSGIAFSLALMGWMPVPIDMAAWHSLWTLERERDTGTHLTAPDRIRRLIGLMAVAFAWSYLVGEKRTEIHGPPPRKAHRRRNRSLFRYGLDRLQGILTTLERQRAAFDACIQALRTPSIFLSGT